MDVVLGLVPAGVFQVPLSHLLHEPDLVVLVFRPAHVKDVGPDLPRDEFFHEIIPLVEEVSAGEFLQLPVPYLSPQPVEADVLADQCHECDLVREGRKDQVSRQQEAVEEDLGPLVVSDVIKAGVGRVGGVKEHPGTVVLKDNVVVLARAGLVVKPLAGGDNGEIIRLF